jgi:hypothetical protein
LQSCVPEYGSCECHWLTPSVWFWTLGLPNRVDPEVVVRVTMLSWFQAIRDCKWM